MEWQQKTQKSMVNRALHLNESAPLSLKGPPPPQQSDASEEDEDLKLLLTPSSSAEELRLITARVTHARSTAKKHNKDSQPTVVRNLIPGQRLGMFHCSGLRERMGKTAGYSRGWEDHSHTQGLVKAFPW